MTESKIKIALNGVTGRMGLNQHLVNSILAIRKEGGLELGDGTKLVPEPVLVGRNADKLKQIAAAHGVAQWTTDLDAALADPEVEIYCDAGSTLQRADNLEKALKAGKHVYCEKPISADTGSAVKLCRLAREKGLKSGVVQDKLWAPGLRKLKYLKDTGFFGRVLTVRISGTYWVFEGDLVKPQRPSWNYRKEDGGSMILDMMPHYRYMLDIFAPARRMVCLGATHIPQRWDEQGKPYACTADDAAYAIVELEGGIVAPIDTSWCIRAYSDDIINMKVDGTDGSAVAGLTKCSVQRRETTPRGHWSLDVAKPVDFFEGWQEMPEPEPYRNAFRAEWELFLRHVYEGGAFAWDLLAGARGVQFAELAEASWRESRWVDVPDLGA
jgi:predicted dehydrogenase